jgi:PAS domain S-box-containing protein
MGAEELDVGLLTSELLDGVFACSKSGEIMFSNPAFARMLGFRHEAMKAKNIAKDIVERDLVWRARVSLLEQGSPIHD